MSSRLLTKALNSLSAAASVAKPSSSTFAPLSSVAKGDSFSLPDLAYDYAALEPSVNAEIMELHHSKHHQTYVTNLNAALDKYSDAEAKGDLGAMIALQGALKFNGGGHVNHSIFWTNLAPASAGGGEPPSGELATYIEKAFGDFDSFKKKMITDTAAVQGSGWGWLGYDKEKDAVRIVTTANQDPCSTTGLVPLLGIDVWEHAYYLQYKNVRPDYLNAIFEVVDFGNVASRLADAKK